MIRAAGVAAAVGREEPRSAVARVSVARRGERQARARLVASVHPLLSRGTCLRAQCGVCCACVVRACAMRVRGRQWQCPTSGSTLPERARQLGLATFCGDAGRTHRMHVGRTRTNLASPTRPTRPPSLCSCHPTTEWHTHAHTRANAPPPCFVLRTRVAVQAWSPAVRRASLRSPSVHAVPRTSGPSRAPHTRHMLPVRHQHTISHD